MDGKWVWFDNGRGRQVMRKVYDAPPPARSELPCPLVITDNIEVQSMVDGKMYTSKAALRQSYREKGYIEVGNEEMKTPPKPEVDRKRIRESAARALNQVGISV